MTDEGQTDPDRTKVTILDPLVGMVLDRRYRIELRLAAGGFGAIYRATHVITGREVALKVLHTRLATQQDVVARFRREAATLARLHDPHTITAYDFGETSDGTLYIVMELLQGESLYEQFRALGPLPWQRVVTIARSVCSSLGEAHALGIIHRDLKPTNIHLERIGSEPDFVKVLDFGIAKILHGNDEDTADLTRSGEMIGTFDYMAPEQMVGGPCTGQSDIYTLGVVIYEMISGEKPLGERDTPAAMLAAIIQTTAPPLSSKSDAPEELDPIIAKCLEREPAHRFGNVDELAGELERVLAMIEEGETKIRITRAPSNDDTQTSVGNAPEPLNPMTTLPGVAPPQRNKPWPLLDPRRKR